MTDKVGDLLRPVIDRLEKELGSPGLILVRRLPQQFDPLLVRRLFLFRCASKSKVAERFLFVEPHAIEERELGVHAMSQHHVTEFVGKDGREAGLVRKKVHHTPPPPAGLSYPVPSSRLHPYNTSPAP